MADYAVTHIAAAASWLPTAASHNPVISIGKIHLYHKLHPALQHLED